MGFEGTCGKMEEKHDLIQYLREEDIFLKDPHTKKAKHVSMAGRDQRRWDLV